MASIPLALQLYSVRDHMDKDPANTLKRLRAMGYTHVECAGYYGLTPTQYRSILDDAGLRAVSAHVGYSEVVEHPQDVIAAAKEIGFAFVVMPYMGDNYEDRARCLDASGAMLRAAGIRLCYHNHDHELLRGDGLPPMNTILETASPENLAVELDTAWATLAGENAPAYIRHLGSRCPLLHIKDYARNETGFRFVPVGEGTMDFASLLTAGKEVGVQWYVIEQDEWGGEDSLDCAERSLRNAEKF